MMQSWSKLNKRNSLRRFFEPLAVPRATNPRGPDPGSAAAKRPLLAEELGWGGLDRPQRSMAATSTVDKEEGFMEHLQKASDEAIDLIYEMFGMKSKGEGSA